MRHLAALTLLIATGCNSVTATPTPPKKKSASTGPTSPETPPASASEPAPTPLLAEAPPGSVQASGEVTFLEKSGDNLYVEIKVGDSTVGVELFPGVARRFAGKISKGEQLTVQGKRVKGSKEIAYVVEVSDPALVRLGAPAPAGAGAAKLARIPLPKRFPSAPVEMIAAYGMWPPFGEAEIKDRVSKARTDAVGRLVLDTGLTELSRAYNNPAPFYQVLSQAAGAAQGQGIRTAFYFPSFEIRKEKEDRSRQPLGKWQPEWAQHTLTGKPLIKTAFGKEEFWNREGDEAMWVCPNSPWRKTFIDRMKGAVKRGATTLFVDVPYFQVTGKQMTCRCKHCQARFKKETGQTIPRKPAPGSYAYHRWLWWRHEVLAGFFAELRTAVRKVDARARLVVEEFPAYVDGATTNTGVDIGLVGNEVDIFAHEYSAKQFDKKAFSFNDRLDLAAALALYRGLDGDRPTWVLSYAHDVAGSHASAALHLCYDASFWETKGSEMNDTTVGRAWRRKLFSWFASNRALFGDGRQLASVALLYSPASRDFGTTHFKTLMQVIRTLIRAAVPLSVVSTRDIARLADHATVVLPDVVALTDGDAAALRRHRGRLLVVGKPPSRDGWGVKAADHRLRHTRVSVADLPSSLKQVPLRVQAAIPLAVNLLAKKGEIQVRLAGLQPGRTTIAIVSLIPPRPVATATQLTLLGRESKLPLPATRSDGSLTIPVQVKDLTILRLRLR